MNPPDATSAIVREPASERRQGVSILQAKLARIVTHRLPATLKLSARLGRGERLTPQDLELLRTVQEEARHAAHLAADAPAYRTMAIQMIHLHSDILRRAGTAERELCVRIAPVTMQRQ